MTLCDPVDGSMQGFLPITKSQSLLKLMSIKPVMPPNHLILHHFLLLLPSIFPASGSFPMSQFLTSGGQSIGVSALASILPVNIQDEFPLGLTGCNRPLVVHGTLKSLLQHHSSKASTLWCSTFFMVQFSNPYMTSGKPITLT